jgi:hypothetical protein
VVEYVTSLISLNESPQAPVLKRFSAFVGI